MIEIKTSTGADKLVKLLILECKLIVTPFLVETQEYIELSAKTFYI